VSEIKLSHKRGKVITSLISGKDYKADLHKINRVTLLFLWVNIFISPEKERPTRID
jgi:hypothetical protein